MHATTRFAALLALLCFVLTVTATPIALKPNGVQQQARTVPIERELTNAQRIARGLPLNKPKRTFDPLVARAPMPSRRSGEDDYEDGLDEEDVLVVERTVQRQTTSVFARFSALLGL